MSSSGDDEKARDELGHMRDRQQIEDVMYRYGRAIDRRDWELLASCFTADVRADYGVIGASMDGVEVLVAATRQMVEGMTATQHLIASPLVTVDGDEADGAFYAVATHVLETGRKISVGGSYENRFRRSAEGWRISLHAVRPVWSDDNGELLAGLGTDAPGS
jgi:ketosteroid isomerase-like protein